MNILLKDIATVVNAQNDWKEWAEVSICSVEFDNRQVAEGALFIPLQGGARDGHDFVKAAYNSGAVASLWADNVTDAPTEQPHLVVADTLVALQQLSAYYLEKVGAKVIGVTGSNGKTTTKDMLAGVLSQRFKTHKTQGNYNNEIGLPYTILKMPETTEVVVLEMGMTGFGEIEELSLLAKPDVAAITMIGESHLEFLGSRQGIAKAKMEIVSGLKPEGLLVVPGFEPLLSEFLKAVSQEVVSFGIAGDYDLQGTILEENQETTVFKTNQTEGALEIPVLGRYNVANALIAVAVGRHFGLTDQEIRQGLLTMNLTQSRTEWLVASNGAAVLSDVYNANPTAMGLVLDTVATLPNSGRKIAVLADMGELGPDWQALHESMSDHLEPEVYSQVYLYGPLMKTLARKLKDRTTAPWVSHYDLEGKQQLITDLKNALEPADMVVLKGSNSMKLIEIVESLIEN